MNLNSLIALRPLCFFASLAFVVLLLPSLLIPFWIVRITRISEEVRMISHSLHQELLLGIENTEKLLLPLNSSAPNLARILSSSLDGTELNFSKIESEVAPVLFQTLSTIPHLSQISYIGLNGLFFSYYYYKNSDKSLAAYSNSSFNASSKLKSEYYTWYTQPVNQDTGKLYGEAAESQPLFIVKTSWFRKALNSTKGYASLSTSLNRAQDLVFLSTAVMNGGRSGAISLGYLVKPLVDFFSALNLLGGSLYLATEDGTVLAKGITNTRMKLVGTSVSIHSLKPKSHQQEFIGDVACEPRNKRSSSPSVFNIGKKQYSFQCSPIDLIGVPSVYVLALPHKGTESLVQKNIKLARELLIVIILVMLITVFTFVLFNCRAARREMRLCAALIKQMEATQQAERKSMNKSLAFATASHDVRASLAGITALIEMCRDDVSPESEMETNLTQMEACTKDLLGILNSILDTSKIEAGKMLLEEEEFDLARLLEDVGDMYQPVGMKKGVDVVLDPCDGSVTKFPIVIGDRGKLKQVLCNLLSNAVKFTSEGHVSIRAWVKKPSFEDYGSSERSSMGCLACLFFQDNESHSHELQATNRVQHDDSNCMEFVFEVDDTGKGIPKEKHTSVFENYVQVKETALGEGGTGLGLGIVQSLVRLMGGDIEILDKEMGERGTCFRFNVFLTACASEIKGIAKDDDYGDVESVGGYLSSTDSHQNSATTSRIHYLKPQQQVVGGSEVVLFLQSEERQRISMKYMARLGIKVTVVRNWEQLTPTLKQIKKKLTTVSRNSRSSSRSHSAGGDSVISKDVPLGALDGNVATDQLAQHFHGMRKTIVVVIDTNAGPFRELSRSVAEFRRDLLNTCCCRVVWIDKPGVRNVHTHGLDENKLPSTDLIISKAFHGSRLDDVIRLLPEFGAPASGTARPNRKQDTLFSPRQKQSNLNSRRGQHGNSTPQHLVRSQNHEIQLETGGPSCEKPLTGKKVLVAEDNPVLRRLAVHHVSQLGAAVETCENGKEALELVCTALGNARKRASPCSTPTPYDYILMDCEMSVMDGLEATRRIREEEQHYGVYTPIIALTARTTREEASVTLQAGMDFHLSKPLKKEHLLDAIAHIHSQLN